MADRRGGTSRRDADAVARFVERFAGGMADAGMPRMPARVFAALLSAEDGALTAAELSQQLQASAAAISGAVRYLAQLGMVQRDREPGERRDIYRLYSDTWYELIASREQLYVRWIDALQEGVDAVGAASRAGKRLDETRRFFDFVRAEVPAMIDRWRDQQRPPVARRGR